MKIAKKRKKVIPICKPKKNRRHIMEPISLNEIKTRFRLGAKEQIEGCKLLYQKSLTLKKRTEELNSFYSEMNWSVRYAQYLISVGREFHDIENEVLCVYSISQLIDLARLGAEGKSIILNKIYPSQTELKHILKIKKFQQKNSQANETENIETCNEVSSLSSDEEKTSAINKISVEFTGLSSDENERHVAGHMTPDEIIRSIDKKLKSIDNEFSILHKRLDHLIAESVETEATVRTILLSNPLSLNFEKYFIQILHQWYNAYRRISEDGFEGSATARGGHLISFDDQENVFPACIQNCKIKFPTEVLDKIELPNLIEENYSLDNFIDIYRKYGQVDHSVLDANVALQ